MAPEGARWAAPALGVLAVAAILFGALVCLAQTDLKRLIAFSSVGHMGFVLLGIATLTATGLQAALIGNVAHGVITGLLFFLVGAIKDRYAHRLAGRAGRAAGDRAPAGRAARLRGRRLAGAARPGRVLGRGVRRGGRRASGAARSWLTLAVLAALGGALTAAYFLRLLRRVTHGPAQPGGGRLAPALAGAELTAWAPLVLLALAVGLAPALVLSYASGPVEALLGVVAMSLVQSVDNVAMLPALPGAPAPRCWCCWSTCWWPGRAVTVAVAALGAAGTAAGAALVGAAGDPAHVLRRRRLLLGVDGRAALVAAVIAAAHARRAGAVRPAAARRAYPGRRVLLPARLRDDRRRGARRGR